jgi:hypothetical protein
MSKVTQTTPRIVQATSYYLPQLGGDVLIANLESEKKAHQKAGQKEVTP